MRATEGLTCYNLECNPTLAEDKAKLSHLDIEEAKSLRKRGLKNRPRGTPVGHENSSHEFTKKQILEMIKERKDKDGWEFTFLGANQDAIDEGAQIGVGVAQSMTYNQSKAGINNTFSALCSNTTSYRAGGNVSYSTLERRSAMEE